MYYITVDCVIVFCSKDRYDAFVALRDFPSRAMLWDRYQRTNAKRIG